MRIIKETGAERNRPVSEGDLAQINQLSRKKLAAEEVYTFTVKLCDNEVDRDYERFSEGTLQQLAELFVGKSGIFDHQWSAKGQTARIYRTELVREDGIITAAGDPYCFLKGYAYMLRTEGNRELIAEIEGGIKKEVSVGCAVSKAVCSICGAEVGKGSCPHEKGSRYEEMLCFHQLEGATDAYEWSFVAVPAQKAAGVMKSKQMRKEEKKLDLKTLLAKEPEGLAALEVLEKEADMGRRYRKALQQEVARLGGIVQPDLSMDTWKGIVHKLEEDERLAVKAAFNRQIEQKIPVKPQLLYGTKEGSGRENDSAFLI